MALLPKFSSFVVSVRLDLFPLDLGSHSWVMGEKTVK